MSQQVPSHVVLQVASSRLEFYWSSSSYTRDELWNDAVDQRRIDITSEIDLLSNNIHKSELEDAT